MTRVSTYVRVLIVLVAVVSSRSARANGAFPAAGQLVADPTSADRLVLRSTFGLVVTADGGATWRWICEAAVGYVDYEPPIAVAADGAILAGLFHGLSVAHADGCDFSLPIEGAYVTDVTAARNRPSRVLASVCDFVADVCWLSTSEDAGRTFTPAGTPLPDGFLAFSLDEAPSDSARVYVAGLQTVAGLYEGAVARSNDGGQSWTVAKVPATDESTAPYIGAIDPADPARLYVRTDGEPGQVIVSSDGGEGWTTAYTGPNRGLALSPDGSTLLVGGPGAGILRASTSDLIFERVAPIGARCLTWVGDVVYACGDEASDGFFVGRSFDAATSFEAVLHLPCIDGPLECADDTTVGSACAGLWPILSSQLRTETCETPPDAGAGAAGGSGSGAPVVPGPSPPPDVEPAPTAHGGGCASTPASPTREAAIVLLLLAVARVARWGRPPGDLSPDG